MTRKHISERTLRAATIVAWLELPHRIAKELSEDEIIGMIEYDHYPIRKADGGPDTHWNLRPLLRHDHKWKTKHDAADMAKERHVRMAVNAHAQRMLLKSTGEKPVRRSRWPKRRLR